MKKTILIVCLALFGYCVFQLFTDDELDTEAKLWIDHFSQAPSLENNAFIAMMALGSNADAPYATAKRQYAETIALMHERIPESADSRLQYPLIDGLPAIFEDSIYCTFDKPQCSAQLLDNRADIERDLLRFGQTLDSFLSLADYQNFDPLDATFSEPHFNIFSTLVRLSATRVFLMIENGELDAAAKALAQMMKLERKLIKHSDEMIFQVTTIVHFEVLYQPLIVRLRTKAYDRWEELKQLTIELEEDELSLNKIWLHQFFEKSVVLSQLSNNNHPKTISGFFNQVKSQIAFKQNMTLNTLYHYTKLKLVASPIDKANLSAHNEKAQQRAAEASQEMTELLINSGKLVLHSPTNIIGTIIASTSTPKIIDLYPEKIALDLRLRLLNALIRSHDMPIADVIGRPEMINPYTGDKPQIMDKTICYQMENPVCIPYTESY